MTRGDVDAVFGGYRDGPSDPGTEGEDFTWDEDMKRRVRLT